MEKIIVWQLFNDFRAMKENDYNKRIWDARKIWCFNHTENFLTFEDVVEYIVKCFKVDRKNIIIKGE